MVEGEGKCKMMEEGKIRRWNGHSGGVAWCFLLWIAYSGQKKSLRAFDLRLDACEGVRVQQIITVRKKKEESPPQEKCI